MSLLRSPYLDGDERGRTEKCRNASEKRHAERKKKHTQVEKVKTETKQGSKNLGHWEKWKKNIYENKKEKRKMLRKG